MKAVDALNPALSSVASITIHILDVNDNFPRFDRQEYRAEIPEDSQEGTNVIRVMVCITVHKLLQTCIPLTLDTESRQLTSTNF